MTLPRGSGWIQNFSTQREPSLPWQGCARRLLTAGARQPGGSRPLGSRPVSFPVQADNSSKKDSCWVLDVFSAAKRAILANSNGWASGIVSIVVPYVNIKKQNSRSDYCRLVAGRWLKIHPCRNAMVWQGPSVIWRRRENRIPRTADLPAIANESEILSKARGPHP